MDVGDRAAYTVRGRRRRVNQLICQSAGGRKRVVSTPIDVTGSFITVETANIKTGALAVVHELREAGYRALLAGGCVRDLLMEREPKDWDVATDADPAAVRELFARTVPIGIEFGIVTVILDDGQYEVARFRSDGEYADGRHPSRVDFSEPQEDARRRDFTINGLFYDPVVGELIDFVDGRADIDAKIVRAIGDPSQRLAEDYLRMVRAVRFAARLGFAIDEGTAAAIAAGADRIQSVSAERLRDELTMILTEGGASRGMQLLMELGLLRAIIPEVAAMDGVAQPPEFHPEGDVWTHVRLMLDQLDRPTPTLAWGVLLHDVGKPPTFSVSDRIRFHDHDTQGARLAEAICARLRMSNQQRERIRDLTAHHMRFRNVREMRASKLKRFLREEYFGELLELHRIDCVASHGLLDLYEYCREQLRAEGDEDLQPVPLLTGRDLIAMGFAPGPPFKAMLAAVEDAQLEGLVSNREQAVKLIGEQFGGG